MRMFFLGFSLAFFSLIGCAAFRDDTKVISTEGAIKPASIRLVFTGFSFYENEKEALRKAILDSGFRESDDSTLLLEIILEEQKPDYPNRKLHFANLLASFFTATIFPYHIITDHRILYRLKEKGVFLGEYENRMRLHQYRGILVMFLSPFYWPSTKFRENTLATWKQVGLEK
jgi:hypothetical protein